MYRVLILLFLCSCNTVVPPVNNDPSITEIRLQLDLNKGALLDLRDNVDSALNLIEIMDSNLSALERRMVFVEKDRSYKDTVYICDTVIYHQFIGNNNLFIRSDKFVQVDTLGIQMNDSVFFKIWTDGQQIINL